MARRSKRVATSNRPSKSKATAKSKQRSVAKPKPATARKSLRKAASSPRGAGVRARQSKPIDLYYWSTPNGWKITIMLEECGLPYNIIPVNISKGDQFEPEFLAISPNNRIPAIIDHDPKGGGPPVSVFESGAILLYLAEKTGELLPSDLRARYDAIQWLFWQMAGLGPMAGQNHHFSQYAPEKIPYTIDRYVKETNRLYGVLNRCLADRAFITGDYSI